MDWNPVWGPDGKTLYFLSNRDGAMNLWRVPIDEAIGPDTGPGRTADPAGARGRRLRALQGRAARRVRRPGKHVLDRPTRLRRRVRKAHGQARADPRKLAGDLGSATSRRTGSSLAFDSRGGAQDDLFLVDSDGRNMRQITDDAAEGPPPEILPGRKAHRLPLRPRQRPLPDLDRRTGRQRPEAADSGEGAHHRAPLASGRPRHRHQQRPRKLDPPARRNGCRRSASSPSRSLTPETFFYPLAWAPDGKTLAGSVIRLRGLHRPGLATYSPGAGAAVRTVPGTETVRAPGARGFSETAFSSTWTATCT